MQQSIRLRDVEIRHLQALQAVATEGSFGRAADRLGFSQSAVSQQIATFEKVIGRRLFDRPGGPRPVQLTPVGNVLLAHAETVLAQLRQAEQEVESLLAGGGRLVIGSFQSVSVKILPAVVGRILGESPELDIRCVEHDSVDEALEPLLQVGLDLAFVIGETLDRFDGVEHALLCTDPFVFISPAGARVPPIVETAELAELPLIGEQRGGSCQTALEDELRSLGVDPTWVFRSNDNSAIQAMVRSGMGHAVMPYLAIEPTDPGIVVRNMRPPLTPRQIRIAWRADRTLLPAASRFIDIATDVCAQLSFGVGAN